MANKDTATENSSNATTNESFDKVTKDAGLDPTKAADYRNVDQGRNVEPLIEGAIKPKANAKNKDKKGKKGGKKGKTAGIETTGSKSKRTIKDEATCSFCSNSMTQSEEMNWHPEKGVKSPVNADGEDRYNPAPGAPTGKLSPVLCDDCERALNSGTSFRDFRTVVAERADTGKIENVAVTDLTR